MRNRKRVVISVAGRLRSACGPSLCLAMLLVGCSESSSSPVEPEAPAISLAVPVLEAAPADMHALVPADSVGYLQAVSLEAIQDVSNAYMRQIDPTLAPNDPREWLAGLGLCDPSRVDLSRPFGVAVSTAPGDFPITFIFASSDADALSSTAAPGIAVTTQGDYVAFSPSGDPGELGSPLTAGLPAGAISGRFDLPPLVDAARAPLEVGLSLVQMQAASQPSPAGIDMQALMGACAEMARGFIDAVESLEFTIRQGDRELGLSGVLTMKEGSSLGGFPPPERGNLRDLASRVNADAPILMLMRADIGELADRFQDTMRMMMSAYFPDDGGETDLDEMMAGWSALYRLALGTYAGSFAFGDELMSCGLVEASNPAALVSAYTQLVEEGLMNMSFSEVEFESEGTIEGVPVSTFRGKIDMEMLQGDQTDPAIREQMRRTWSQMGILEDGMLTHLLHHEDRVGMIVGSSDTSADASFARALSGPAGELEPGIAKLVDQLDSHDAGFAVRVDFMAYMRSVAKVLSAEMRTESFGEFEGSALMTMMAAVSGNDWDLSLSIDLAGLLSGLPR